MVEPALFDEEGAPHAVDHEHDVVADEDGGDKEVFVAVKHADDARHKAAALEVELHAHAVGCDVGYLRSGKERGEY